MLESLISLVRQKKNHDRVPVYTPSELSLPASPDPEALFREHYSRLFRALAVALGDAEAAADAAQEAFIQLCLHWRQVKRHRDPARWLRHTALHGFTSSSTLRHHLPGLPSPPGTLVPSAEPLSKFRGDLEAALTHLSLPERLALVLHYMEDLTPEEIADALDLSEDHAGRYLRSAREKLQPNLMPGSCPETIIY